MGRGSHQLKEDQAIHGHQLRPNLLPIEHNYSNKKHNDVLINPYS